MKEKVNLIKNCSQLNNQFSKKKVLVFILVPLLKRYLFSVPNYGHAMANVAIFNFKWPWVFFVHGQPYWTSKSAKCGHIWLFKKFWQKLGLLQQIFGHLWQILVFFEIFLKTFALLQKLEKYFLETFEIF